MPEISGHGLLGAGNGNSSDRACCGIASMLAGRLNSFCTAYKAISFLRPVRSTAFMRARLLLASVILVHIYVTEDVVTRDDLFI